MKRRFPAVFSGGLITVLLLSVVTTALAVGGKTLYNNVNVAIFGEKQVAAGELYLTASGTKVPSTITYTDEIGSDTIYLPVRMMADLLGANISWDSASKTVDFAAASPSDFELAVGTPPTFEQMATSPLLGIQAGPFTEIAPVQEKSKAQVLLDNAAFRSKTGLMNQFYSVIPELGNYIEIQLTNHGAPVGFYVERPILLSANAGVEQFTAVRLNTGKTLTRAFIMSESDVRLDNLLKLTVVALGGMENETDITVTITQYAVKK